MATSATLEVVTQWPGYRVNFLSTYKVMSSKHEFLFMQGVRHSLQLGPSQ